MSQLVENYRWSAREFITAWEAGAFDRRVELVDGEVWPVNIGFWHGSTVGMIIGQLRLLGVVANTASLPSGGSVPDPDCWVLRPGAIPVERLGPRQVAWSPADVFLVVEVSDTTVMADLTIKDRIYGTAGYPVYWVVTEERIYEHTEPKAGGYAVRREYGRGDRIPLRHLNCDLAVEDLIALPLPTTD